MAKYNFNELELHKVAFNFIDALVIGLFSLFSFAIGLYFWIGPFEIFSLISAPLFLYIKYYRNFFLRLKWLNVLLPKRLPSQHKIKRGFTALLGVSLIYVGTLAIFFVVMFEVLSPTAQVSYKSIKKRGDAIAFDSMRQIYNKEMSRMISAEPGSIEYLNKEERALREKEIFTQAYKKATLELQNERKNKIIKSRSELLKNLSLFLLLVLLGGLLDKVSNMYYLELYRNGIKK